MFTRTRITEFKWLLLIVPIALLTGLLVAMFLWLMELVNTIRWNNMWLIFGLAPAGILISWLYNKAGKNAGGGNDLIIEEIHQPGAGVPARMTPLILVATLLTHLFGGSAGREGTAVQMGGGIAAWCIRQWKLQPKQVSVLLMCGVAAGFGAVFGTPVAGAVFAIEVLISGRFHHRAILPCLAASFLGDIVVRLIGVHHTAYEVLFVPGDGGTIRWISKDFILLLKMFGAGVIFGYASRLFTYSSHIVKNQANKLISLWWLRPVAGAVLVIGISYAIGSFDYLGLGVTNPSPAGVSIVSAFQPGGAGYFSWFWKLLLTVITLGFGFKGGEVTPLFFIGATLANVLAVMTGSPVDLFAAAGFLAVFAGATNTPLACTIMGLELFGADNFLFFAVACFTAYFFSGNSSIYPAQRRL